MTLVRWLHKTWNFLWKLVAVFSLILVLVGSLFFGIIQLKPTKIYITTRIEQNFSSKYQGVLTIGSLDGLMPLSFELKNVNLYPDSSSIIPVFHADSLSANLDILALFKNQFIINGLSIYSPQALIDNESNTSLFEALKKKRGLNIDSSTTEQPFLEIVAPRVSINNGRVVLRNVLPDDSKLHNGDSLTFNELNASMFFEYRKEQRFFDIDNLTFQSPEMNIEFAQIFGQVYNDNRFLEFNSFNFNTTGSSIKFSGEADGIDIFNDDIVGQLKESSIQLSLDELILTPERMAMFSDSLPELTQPVMLSFKAQGVPNSVGLEELSLQYGNSGFTAFGKIDNLLTPGEVEFDLGLRETLLEPNDILEWVPNVNTSQLNALSNTTFRADVKGNLEEVQGAVSGVSDRGKIEVAGNLGLAEKKYLNIQFITESLDLGGLLSEGIKSTDITSSGVLETIDYSDFQKIEKFEASVSKGQFSGVRFDSLFMVANTSGQTIFPEFNAWIDNSFIDGSGQITFTESAKDVQFSGSGIGIDLKNLSQIEQMADIIADIEYEIDLSIKSIDDFVGQVSIDIPFATSGTDTIPSHLVYADVSEAQNGDKLARITTSLADLNIQGEFFISEMKSLFSHWNSFFTKRISQEFFFDSVNSVSPVLGILRDQRFSVDLEVKDLSYLYYYFPTAEQISSQAELSTNISVDKERLLFSADLIDERLEYKDNMLDSIRTQFTGSFRYGNSLQEFSLFRIQASVGSLKSELLDAQGITFDSGLGQDSIDVSGKINKIGGNSTFSIASTGTFSDSSLSFFINDFKLGSEFYSWVSTGTPFISVTNEEKVIINNFTFNSEEQYLNIEGVFSSDNTDSVDYLIRNVDLGRISEMINGRVDFGGDLNGSFTTRSLTQLPTIEGDIDLNAFSLNQNIVGDLNIDSRFNQELNRFDTTIEVLTDSAKYPNYFIRNDRVGQNILIDGYVLAPSDGAFPETDSLFYFDLDFNAIDLWVIPFLAPKVFTEMSGIASGEGSIWGNLDDFDFSVDYMIGMDDAVYMKPKFLDTYYYGQGPVTFTKKDGLVFEDIYLIDPSGGMAILDGYYNFNGFQPRHSMDITIDTEEFQFLNNRFDPIVPFYGTAYGTGVVRLTGSNLNPVVTTIEPMLISDFSEIGLPLLEETEFDEDNKFIRFVETFDTYSADSLNQNRDIFDQASEVDISELTFNERFTLDLQFISEQSMTVRLIFDPVTGDIITTDGTGRLGIQLRDQELSIFGRFDIAGGNYQFVSGDIFARRFVLEPGGSIVWDGDPVGARLNLNAVYSARPNIQTLSTARSEINQDDAQRARVELVLNVGGSLESIENNFFFRLPNTIESRQNSTLSTQIAALNRNEDEKLLQATSFLLMGDFIPSNSTTDAATSLTDNFSSSAAVLNPLLSNQVISPLLSNQINSLLRSDLNSLDVDFNLNTYNQVDLGVALRLYNDKLILRRDGQITGAQSNIGDIGATYKINRTFSVTAFHRQDPTFSSFDGNQAAQQSQDINGLGVEAEFSFNTWNEFFRRLANPFRKIFKKKNKEEVIAGNEIPAGEKQRNE